MLLLLLACEGECPDADCRQAEIVSQWETDPDAAAVRIAALAGTAALRGPLVHTTERAVQHATRDAAAAAQLAPPATGGAAAPACVHNNE